MIFIKQLIYKLFSNLFMPGCTSLNSAKVRRSCRSKRQAREKFIANQVPCAKGEIFLNPVRAFRFARKQGYPLVIKPNIGTFSRGSHFPINNKCELAKAIFFAKLWWPSTVIEQYLDGRNYRVLVKKDKIISIIRRYPAFITGTGNNTIEQLIDEENNKRNEMELTPCIHKLVKDKKIQRFIAKKGYQLSSIPEKNQVVYLHNRIALAAGGVIETIDKETIPTANKEIFLKVIKLFDANILGIDVIFEKGITENYAEQKCIFLEVNSRPYAKMHNYPRYGKKEDLSSYFAELNSIDIKEKDIF